MMTRCKCGEAWGDTPGAEAHIVDTCSVCTPPRTFEAIEFPVDVKRPVYINATMDLATGIITDNRPEIERLRAERHRLIEKLCPAIVHARAYHDARDVATEQRAATRAMALLLEIETILKAMS